MFEQRKIPFGVKTVSMATPEEKRTNMNFFAVKAALFTPKTQKCCVGSPGRLIRSDLKTISGCDKRKQPSSRMNFIQQSFENIWKSPKRSRSSPRHPFLPFFCRLSIFIFSCVSRFIQHRLFFHSPEVRVSFLPLGLFTMTRAAWRGSVVQVKTESRRSFSSSACLL